MASRINTKFVIMLCIAGVVMLALVGVAYSIVKKSGSEYEALGDKMMAEGDYEKAKMFYGKAVSDDRSRIDWMGKWVDAMEHITPDTETAYRDAFQTDYLAGINAMSTIQRTNVEAHSNVLDIYYQMLLISYSRGGADNLVSLTTKALTYFDNHPESDTAWQTLRRYRGLAYDRIAQASGVIDDDQFALYKEDLETALIANPIDSDSKAALCRWSLANAVRNQIEGDDSMMIAARSESLAACDAYIEANGIDPAISTMRLTLLIDIARNEASEGLSNAERTVAILEKLSSFQPEVDSLFANLMSIDPSDIPTWIVDHLMRIESATDQASMYRQTQLLMGRLIEADPQDANRLWSSARIDQQINERDGAILKFEQIVAMPTRPLSFEGMMLFTRKRQSLVSIADIKLDQYQLAKIESQDGAFEDEQLLSEIEQLATEFGNQVSEDDNQLLMMRGRIMEAKGELNDALSMYKKYNEQTKRGFAEGLWREGLVAHQLGQLGTARTAILERCSSLRMLKSDSTITAQARSSTARSWCILQTTSLLLRDSKRQTQSKTLQHWLIQIPRSHWCSALARSGSDLTGLQGTSLQRSSCSARVSPSLPSTTIQVLLGNSQCS
jgi:tetratricopeptide (TPR) repeat protein